MKKAWVLYSISSVLVGLFALGVYLVKFPVSTVEKDYIVKKFAKIAEKHLSIESMYRSWFGDTFAKAVYIDNLIYFSNVSFRFGDLFDFMTNENVGSFDFFAQSATLKLPVLCDNIAFLGLQTEDRVDIVTNIVESYKKEITNLVQYLGEHFERNKDIFRKNDDKLILVWLDVSEKISRRNVILNREVSKKLGRAEEFVRNFSSDVLSKAFYKSGDYSLVTQIVQSEQQKLEEEFKKLESEVSGILSKIEILNDGYRMAWDLRKQSFLNSPERYFEKYAKNILYFSSMALANYRYIPVKREIKLKDAKISITVVSNLYRLSMSGYYHHYKFVADLVLGDMWNGVIKMYTTSESGNIVKDNKVENVALSVVLYPSKEVFDEKVTVQVINGNSRKIAQTILSSEGMKKYLLSNITNMNFFLDVTLESEVYNMIGSYDLQFEKYYRGILNEVDQKVKGFEKKVNATKSRIISGI